MERVAYAKARAAQQREYLQGVRRHFFKKVKPQVEREANGSQRHAAAPPEGSGERQNDFVRKRKREDDEADEGDVESGEQDVALSGNGPKRSKMEHGASTRGGSEGQRGGVRVDPRTLPSEIAEDRKKAKKVARLLAQPNRYSGAMKQALSAAEKRDGERREASQVAAEVDKRRAARRKLSKAYAERTRTGQPVMAHRVKDLLRKVERSVGSGGR